MYQITISDVLIEVEKKKVKNIRITVAPPDGKVRISAPLRIEDKVINDFATSKIKWIKKHQEKFRSRKRLEPKKYESGETHYFKGVPYKLIVNETYSLNKIKIGEGNQLELYVIRGNDADYRKSILTEWYRMQMKKEMPLLIEKWEKVVGVKINDWGIKKMKTKWGTCNIRAKRIWLNLELMKRTQRCLESVLVHELVHLHERLHNKRFYSLMDKYMPDWREYDKELKEFGID